MTDLIIRPLEAKDRDKWWELWQGYITFYKASVADDVSEVTWQRLLDEDQPAFCRVAEHTEHGVVAIMNYILHLNLWTTKPVCYLEDLFTDPEIRGQGAGRALIESLKDAGKAEDWYRIYWMTAKDNETARALYDQVASETPWMRYDIPL
jgi:GNAT superfamily N-acetyltransferase